MAKQTERILQLDAFIAQAIYSGDIISQADYRAERTELQEELSCVDECPHCGSEMDTEGYEIQSSGSLHCHVCDRDYEYTAEYVVSFTTSKK